MNLSIDIEANVAPTKGARRDELRHRRRLATLLARHQHELAARMYQYHFDPDWVSRWKIAGVSDHPKSFFVSKFLLPLLRLLITSLKTYNESVLCIYLDERLRYAPHREEWSRRADFHRQLALRDFEQIVDLCADETLDVQALRGVWDDIHSPLLTEVGDKGRINLLAVGDCLLNEVRVFLPHRARGQGLGLDIRCAYFSASAGGLNAQEIRELITSSKVDLLSFSFFSYMGLPKYVQLMEQCDRLRQEEIDDGIAQLMLIVRAFLLEVRSGTQIPFLLHTVCGLPLRRWRQLLPVLPPLTSRQRYVLAALNRNLIELAAAIENCLIIDEEAVVKRHGGLRRCWKQVVSPRRFKGLFHTAYFGDFLSQVYLDYVAAFARLRKAKAICVDFDNTLWRGVMVDEEVEHRPERQRLLMQLRDSGMLLIALSKNSESSIRWQEMVLKADDFVLRKIGWNTKVQSLKEAAQSLNLGIDSFVVVDDSAQERALIAKELPEVVCLDSEEAATWLQLQWLLQFPNTQQTEEARNRTRLYREQAERQQAMAATVDYPEMMASLKLWYRFGRAESGQINRICELIARTNQFNTTTIRYAKQELSQLLHSPGVHLFTAELGDRFGSLGLTAVVILRERRQGGSLSVLVDSFVMSCRAMGFGLEDQVVNEIKGFSRQLGAGSVVGRYIPTDRNVPCAQVYSRNGFLAAGETEFVWDVRSEQEIRAVPWLRNRD